jgi:S-adenosylmethionine synthetase
MRDGFYTAESVTKGHPDKLADRIADAILDACLEQDPESRVACEVLLTKGKALIAGEITTKAAVDYIDIARDVIEATGYSTKLVDFESRIHKQSGDISGGVDMPIEARVGLNNIYNSQGAGDQGIVYGYACDDTENYMPLPIELAHKLTRRLDECNEMCAIYGLMPDGKAQVTLGHADGKFNTITSLIVSAQHEEGVNPVTFAEEIKREVIMPVVKESGLHLIDDPLINPSGRFVEGGFDADTGLTGRKIIVDTYGGMAHHGGGAFSGKDPSKVDRSGAYMARYAAKNIWPQDWPDNAKSRYLTP